MNNEKDKGVDDLFKRKLEDPVNDAGYREEDWATLEQMLDKHKKRKGIVYWLPVLSGVAAMLLLFLGWWSLRPKTDSNSKNHLQAVSRPKKENSGTNGGSIRLQTEHKQKTQKQSPANAVTYAVNNQSSKESKAGKPFFKSLSAAGSRRAAGPGDKVIKDTDPGNTLAAVVNTDEYILASNPVTVFAPAGITAQPIKMPEMQRRNVNAANPANRTAALKAKPKAGYRPQFALSVLAAPDINGVGSFQQGKVGTNEGLLFSAGISRKFTISTGAIYSMKPYLTTFENYHTPYHFAVDPVNVSADCRMLDIPLNISYQVYNKQQNRISFGTGLSSYIMLHESYKFNYANPYITGPADFTVPGVNKYFFGVVNLNATYEHQVSSKVSISFQPYLKLPLTNIGYSQVKLQTTGVAVGLNWNFSSMTKH